MSHLEDDGGLSSDFTIHDDEQTLWIGVRPIWYGNDREDHPTIQVCYQNHGEALQGPVFIDEDTWDQVVRAVEWRRTRYLSKWKQFLYALIH
jgi:hypothetical protein